MVEFRCKVAMVMLRYMGRESLVRHGCIVYTFISTFIGTRKKLREGLVKVE